MEKIPKEVLLIAVKQIIDDAKITDKAAIDIFTIGFIAGSNFTQENL
jgi:hypothetical protein